MGPLYTTSEVASICKVSLRQLQWWDERGIASPSFKQSHRRQYTQSDLDLIRVIAELREKGISTQQIRRIAPELRAKRDRFILTDGKSVWTATSTASALGIVLNADNRVVIAEFPQAA